MSAAAVGFMLALAYVGLYTRPLRGALTECTAQLHEASDFGEDCSEALVQYSTALAHSVDLTDRCQKLEVKMLSNQQLHPSILKTAMEP